jgi:nitrite reductase/ring-hydroxylating ferredoxin subunit
VTDWIRVASTAECPPGSATEIVAAGEVIALFNVEGRYYALDGICPHQGGPLGKGELCGQIITCPWHGWQFDVVSGQHLVNESIRHRRFAVKIEDGRVLVRVENEA